MAACLARSGRGEVRCGSEVLAALAAVLRLYPEGSDRAKAAAAVVDSGAVPALVRTVRTFTDLLEELNPHRKQPPFYPSSPPGPKAAAKKEINVDSEGGGYGCCFCPKGHGAGVRSSSASIGPGISIAASESDANLDRDDAPKLQPTRLAAWDALAVLEQLLLPGPAVAAGVTKAAAAQALSCGAAEALLPLLSLPPPREDRSWRVLRLLLVLSRFSNSTTTRSSTPTTAPRTDAGNGAYASGGASAAAGGSENGLLERLLSPAFAAAPEAIGGLLQATQELLATPNALTDGTSETLFTLASELLLLHSATITTGGSSGSASGRSGCSGTGALITVELLQQHAPALVKAAAGVLTGSRPGASWNALLPCARERQNPAVTVSTAHASTTEAAVAWATRGSVRFPVQLEAAAARLMKELLAWALAVDDHDSADEEEAGSGRDRGGKTEPGAVASVSARCRRWRSWLPVTQIAASLVQRWLDRPGIFEALGEPGVQCLTLTLQLAPPAELWAGERCSDIPRVCRKVKTLLERYKYISAWQLALVAAVSVTTGSSLLNPPSLQSPLHPAATAAIATATDAAAVGFLASAAAASVSNIADDELQQLAQQQPEREEEGGSQLPGPQSQQAQMQTVQTQAQGVQTGGHEASQQSAGLNLDLDLIIHLTSLMASVKLAKLPPLERLGIVAGALNAAVACIAPRRVVREDSRRHQQQQVMLLPSLAKMQLLLLDEEKSSSPEAEEAAQQQQEVELAEGVDSAYVVVRVETSGGGSPAIEQQPQQGHCHYQQQRQQLQRRQRQALLKAMSSVLSRLNDLMAAATEAVTNYPTAREEEEMDTGGGAGAYGYDGELNGSFTGIDIREVMPLLGITLGVCSSAAAVIGEGFPGGSCGRGAM